MKKTYILYCLFFLIFLETVAQSRLKFEIYTGPQLQHQQLKNDPDPSMNFRNNISNHLGGNLLFGLKNDWQLTFQSELAGLNYSYDLPRTTPTGETIIRFTDNWILVPHFRIGLRKSWEKENYAFFIQPSLGVSTFGYSELIEIDTVNRIYSFKRNKTVVGNIGVEAGLKFYTSNKNYFLLGIRHHQGLGTLNKREFGFLEQDPVPFIQNRGSYTGLVLGYGIDFKGKTKTTKGMGDLERVERKAERRSTAWGDGPYLAVTGFFRFRPKSERIPNLEFSNIYGGNQLLAGYTFNSLSLETGYVRMGAYTRNDFSSGNRLRHVSTSYVLDAIPIRLRYHYDIGQKNRLRVGVSGAALYTLNTHYLSMSSFGQFSGNPQQSDFFVRVTPLEQESKGQIFYNAGIFSEIPLFNSCMLTWNFSRNFGSPAVGLVNFSGQTNGEPIDFNSSGSLNGWLMELGFKIPLYSILK